MEEFKNSTPETDKDIVFSKAIKAGKRIYYLDVKKNKKGDMFLAITESKKVISGGAENTLVSFEKHKIFLYREDFGKFMDGLNQALDFIEKETTPAESSAVAPNHKSETPDKQNEIKIDIDF